MNINSSIASALILVGITTAPSNIAGGLFWVFAIYIVALGSVYGNPETRWGFWRACFIALISFGMAMFGALIQPAIPYVMNMPVEGAMGIAGAIYPLYVNIPKGLLQFIKSLMEKWAGK